MDFLQLRPLELESQEKGPPVKAGRASGNWWQAQNRPISATEQQQSPNLQVNFDFLQLHPMKQEIIPLSRRSFSEAGPVTPKPLA
jgi:hypothetical protein